MKVSKVIAELSKLDQDSEVCAWWITKEFAEFLIDEETLEPQVWADSVAEFEALELREWEFIAEDLAEIIRERLPIPYTVTDLGKAALS